MTDAAGPDIATLARKAARERRARLEAEAIAEATTRELYLAAERHKALLMSVGDAILATDALGTVTVANRAASRLLDMGNGLLGKPLHEVVHPVNAIDLCQRPCKLEDAIAAGETLLDSETSSRGADGAPFPAAFTYTPILHAGVRIGGILTLRDISARKQAEEARAKMLAQKEEVNRLRELDALKTKFINMAAHELRTPLTPIRTEFYLLRRGLDEIPANARRSVEIIERNFARLARLIEDVLEGARMQAGKLGIRREPIDLASIVRDVVESFRSTIAQKGITLEEDVRTPLPLKGDDGRLTQVIANLLGNAVKFTPAGGRIRIASRLDSNAASVLISDTGPGLDPAGIERLFKPFSQVAGHHQASHDGAGLGLYICKGIVELHGGKIWGESGGPGLGATFTFTIPLNTPMSEPADAAFSRVGGKQPG